MSVVSFALAVVFIMKASYFEIIVRPA